MTGLQARTGRQTRVICDLFSGSCNPDEMTALIDAGVHVKTIDGMHAKIWSNGKVTIVGSANASANGLGFEECEVSSNVEAAALIQEPAFCKKVQVWFDGLWARASPIDEAEIERARGLWTKRRSARHRQTSGRNTQRYSPQPKSRALSKINKCYKDSFSEADKHNLFSSDEIKTKLRDSDPSVSMENFHPSDRCYNLTNAGIQDRPNFHIFKSRGKDLYEYLGENHPYTGLVFWRRQGKDPVVYAEWMEGKLVKCPECRPATSGEIENEFSSPR